LEAFCEPFRNFDPGDPGVASGLLLFRGAAMNISLRGISVSVDFDRVPYIPANLSGDPDSWSPAEDEEIEIKTVEWRTRGFVIRDGRREEAEVLVDVYPLIHEEDLYEIEETIAQHEDDDDV